LDVRNPGKGLFDLIGRRLANPHAEGDVFANRHVWIQRIGLEHHGDIPVLGVDVIDRSVVNGYPAFGRRFQSGDDIQQGGFAATGRPDEDKEFPIVDIDVDILQHLDAAEPLDQVTDFQRSHDFNLSPIRRSGRE
jgi:hypothetical protein